PRACRNRRHSTRSWFSAGGPRVPETLKHQLAGDGRLVVPVGRHIHQTSVVLLSEVPLSFTTLARRLPRCWSQSTASTSSRSRPIGRTKGKKTADLANPLLGRAIGVIYRPEPALFPARAVAAIRSLDLAPRDERRRRARDHRLCRRTRRKLSFRPLSSPPYSFHIIAVL